MKAIVVAAGLLTLAAGAAGPALAQDAGAGAAVYKQRCQTCHAAPQGQAHGIGPNLAGVVGRKAGGTAYNYSAALAASGLTWTKPNLDKFLSGPSKMVPGTRMIISVADAKERADLVGYLATVKQ